MMVPVSVEKCGCPAHLEPDGCSYVYSSQASEASAGEAEAARRSVMVALPSFCSSLWHSSTPRAWFPSSSHTHAQAKGRPDPASGSEWNDLDGARDPACHNLLCKAVHPPPLTSTIRAPVLRPCHRKWLCCHSELGCEKGILVLL